MWTRELLKRNAKEIFKRNYWTCVGAFQHSVNGVQYIDQGVWSMRIVHNGGVAFR